MKNITTYFVLIFLFSLGINAQIDRSIQPKGGPIPEINLDVPQEFELKNGLKVLVVENHKLPRVSFSLRIDNSPIIEGDKAGVSSLLGAMLGNGTLTIPKDQFNEEIDFLGASLNFGSSSASARSLSKYSERILELMADATIKPLLTAEEFDQEKAKLLEGLKNNEKSVDAIAGNVGGALSYGVNHAYGEFITKETVNNVVFNDVLEFYNKSFNPNNAYLIVIGDINYKDVKKQIHKYFKDWEKSNIDNWEVVKPASNLTQTEIDFVDLPDATQASISITNNVELKMNDEDYHAALIANNILGGGGEGYLFLNLREKHGYTYGAYSGLGTSKYGASRFNASAKVRNIVSDSAIVQALKEINRIKTEPVKEETLINAKAKYVGKFVRDLESPQTIAKYALNIKINDLPEDFYTNYLQKINDVTAEDITRVSNKFFKTENARIIVIGNGNEVLENLEKTGIPIKYYDTYANSTDKPNYEIEMPADMDAAKVLNNYLVAIGGKERLDAVNSVFITAEAELQPGVMMNLEMKTTTKNQSAVEISAMGQSFMKSVFNGEMGYIVAQGQRKEMDENEIKKIQSESSPFPEVNYLNGGVTLEKIEKIDGENAYKINIGTSKSIFYSVETGLKIKEIEKSEMGESATFYSEYKEIGEIQFPFKITQSMGPRTIDFLVKEIKINEGVSEVDFK